MRNPILPVPGSDCPTVATYPLNEVDGLEWILDAKLGRLKDGDFTAGSEWTEKAPMRITAVEARVKAEELPKFVFRKHGSTESASPKTLNENHVTTHPD